VPLLSGAPAARASSSQYAVEYIRNLIFEGKLRPGDRVPQEEVANVLHLSRIPVREAIITLTSEGFLRSELHRGAYVEPLDSQSIRDQYSLYGIIYGLASERALERDTSDFLPALRALADELDDASDDRFGDLILQFHRTLSDAAASPRIAVILRSMPPLRPAAVFNDNPASVEAARRHVHAVVDAMASGDIAATVKACRSSMESLGETVVDVLRERGLFDPVES
jgi:DNA-binding GntR family transcriptional regulator